MVPPPAVASAMLAIVLAASPVMGAPAKPWQPPKGKPAPAKAEPARPRILIDGVPDTGQFLADTSTLARVGPRRISVRDYREFWFGTPSDDRPRPDSLGRVEYLNSMIDKDVLGLTALAGNRPLDFEDRATLREHTQKVLSKTLHRRLVSDSVQVTEDDIRDFWRLSTYEQRFRRLMFPDSTRAERSRAALLSGKLKWETAVKQQPRTAQPGGELGWVRYPDMDPWLGLELFHLEPGQISAPFRDAEGWQLLQAMERRPLETPAYNASRRLKRDQLIGLRTAHRRLLVRERMRSQMHLDYDTSAGRIVAAGFAATRAKRPLRPGVIDMTSAAPEISDSDTSRVVARWKDGRMTAGSFIDHVMSVPAVMRPDLTTPDAVIAHIDAVSMEPYLADYARGLGFENDAFARWEIERKREEILVNHLFQDSISSRVSVSRAERREYYENRRNEFVSYPSVRFASMLRHSRESADSLAAALRAGADAVALVRADSLRGVRSSVRTRIGDRPGVYHVLLFEELRPGQVSVQGPDAAGDFAVIQLLSYAAPRQMEFEEVESICDESVQNIKAERLLKAMLARLRQRYEIAARPEMVMRIALTDPTLED